MINAQKTAAPADKLDYILIVTPNFVHFDPAMKALDAGIPVFCEKPLTVTLEEAEKLVKKVREKKIPFALAHTYLGHWTTPVQSLHRPRRIARRSPLGGLLLPARLARH